MSSLVDAVEALQAELATLLAGILERRHAVKNHLGKTADAVEAEIDLICKTFSVASHHLVSQSMLDSYGIDRYPSTIPKRGKDAIPDMEFSRPITETLEFGAPAPTPEPTLPDLAYSDDNADPVLFAKRRK